MVIISDVGTATQAMELVHGYVLKGKPVIIQYGRKRTSEKT